LEGQREKSAPSANSYNLHCRRPSRHNSATQAASSKNAVDNEFVVVKHSEFRTYIWKALQIQVSSLKSPADPELLVQETYKSRIPDPEPLVLELYESQVPSFGAPQISSSCS